MRRVHTLLVQAIAAAALVVPGQAAAQQPAVPQVPPLLDVGSPAPDFSLPGSTRYGVLQRPVRLSDYRGSVVVLAFFYRVRSPG